MPFPLSAFRISVFQLLIFDVCRPWSVYASPIGWERMVEDLVRVASFQPVKTFRVIRVIRGEKEILLSQFPVCL